MVDYIKLRGQDQGPLFRYAYKFPLQKTAFAKYLKAIIANTDLTCKKVSPHCIRIGAATWASQVSPLNKLKPWGAGIPIPTRNISGLHRLLANHLRKVCLCFMSTDSTLTSLHQSMTHVPSSCDDISLGQHCTGEFTLH